MDGLDEEDERFRKKNGKENKKRFVLLCYARPHVPGDSVCSWRLHRHQVAGR